MSEERSLKHAVLFFFSIRFLVMVVIDSAQFLSILIMENILPQNNRTWCLFFSLQGDVFSFRFQRFHAQANEEIWRLLLAGKMAIRSSANMIFRATDYILIFRSNSGPLYADGKISMIIDVYRFNVCFALDVVTLYVSSLLLVNFFFRLTPHNYLHYLFSVFERFSFVILRIFIETLKHNH